MDRLRYETYSENIRNAMDTTDNPHGQPLSIRMVATALGMSYEHVRRVYAGKAAMGRAASDDLCDFLGLPKDKMWRLAQLEKVKERYGISPRPMKETEMADLWRELRPDEREQLMVLAAKMATDHVG